MRPLARLLPALLSTAVAASGLAVLGTPVAPAAAATLTPPLLATYDKHAIAVRADGKPFGIGANSAGELTLPASPTSADQYRKSMTAMTGLPAGVRVVQATAGDSFSVLLGSDGKVYWTGYDRADLDNNPSTITVSTLTPVPMPAGVTSAVAIGASRAAAFMAGDDGELYGVGSNTDNQLGTGGNTTTWRKLTKPPGLAGGAKAVQIGAGYSFMVARYDNGQAAGIGFNGYGQLTGVDYTRSSLGLLALPAGCTLTKITARARTSYILCGSTAYGAGDGSYGQIGRPTLDSGNEYGQFKSYTAMGGLPSGVGAVDVAGGDNHSVVVGSDGIAYGTGSDSDGQITPSAADNNHYRWTLRPIAVQGSHGRAVSAVAGGANTWIGTDTGEVLVAGSNSYFQAGGADMFTDVSPLTAVPVPAGGGSTDDGTVPEITGTPYVGGTAKAKVNTWPVAGATLTYRWLRGSAPISKATAATYKPVAADAGKELSVRVIATKGTSTVTKTSAAVVVLNKPLVYAAKAKPAITGKAKVGKVLTLANASKAGWSPAATTMTIQWYAGGTAIAGATGKTYTVTSSEVGKKLKVVVTGKRSGSVDGTYTTKPTAAVP